MTFEDFYEGYHAAMEKARDAIDAEMLEFPSAFDPDADSSRPVPEYVVVHMLDRIKEKLVSAKK